MKPLTAYPESSIQLPHSGNWLSGHIWKVWSYCRVLAIRYLLLVFFMGWRAGGAGFMIARSGVGSQGWSWYVLPSKKADRPRSGRWQICSVHSSKEGKSSGSPILAVWWKGETGSMVLASYWWPLSCTARHFTSSISFPDFFIRGSVERN